MVELGIENRTKRDEAMTRSVKVVAGACNHRELTLPPIAI